MCIKRVVVGPEFFLTVQPKGKIKNKDLERTKVGYSKDSETRYVSSIRINLKTLGYSGDQELILVDCPGTGDQMGAEVEIANQVGILNAVSQAKEVVPVIFFNGKSGNRAEGIKRMA